MHELHLGFRGGLGFRVYDLGFRVFSLGDCIDVSTIQGATTDWFLVGNGGMAFWDYYRGP